MVDYVIEWNNVHSEEGDGKQKKENTVNKRKATQADWDAFFG